jgi:hypothetical protein
MNGVLEASKAEVVIIRSRHRVPEFFSQSLDPPEWRITSVPSVLLP